MEEVIAYGGIQDPTSGDRRVSHRVQAQPDADDLQLGRAMKAAKLRDIKATTGMSINTSCSILHFSEPKIINNASNLGISFGSNGKEIAKSVNDLLDLEADRALELIRNIAAVKPMNESYINNLGVTALQNLCEDLVPTSVLENEEEDMVSEGYMAPVQPEAISLTTSSHEDSEAMQDKPKRSWKRKVYPTSAVRRSARVRQKKKFHDEK